MIVDKPYIGQKVRLNDHGLSIIFGSTFGVSSIKNKIMKISWVDNEPATDDGCYWVQVDDPEFNECLLYNRCFDKVDGLSGYVISI